jgi:hypothetical protein
MASRLPTPWPNVLLLLLLRASILCDLSALNMIRWRLRQTVFPSVARLEETHGIGGVAMCTHIMASIRQGIEQELIALRATGEVVPLQMVEGACKHQGQLTLQSLDIDYPNFGFLSTDLVEWCSALADGPIRARVLSAFEFEALVCMKTWRVVLRVEPAEAAMQRNGKERATTHRDRSDAQILEEECDIPRGAPPGHPGKRVGLWNTLGGWRVPPRLLQ